MIPNSSRVRINSTSIDKTGEILPPSILRSDPSILKSRKLAEKPKKTENYQNILQFSKKNDILQRAKNAENLISVEKTEKIQKIDKIPEKTEQKDKISEIREKLLKAEKLISEKKCKKENIFYFESLIKIVKIIDELFFSSLEDFTQKNKKSFKFSEISLFFAKHEKTSNFDETKLRILNSFWPEIYDFSAILGNYGESILLISPPKFDLKNQEIPEKNRIISLKTTKNLRNLKLQKIIQKYILEKFPDFEKFDEIPKNSFCELPEISKLPTDSLKNQKNDEFLQKTKNLKNLDFTEKSKLSEKNENFVINLFSKNSDEENLQKIIQKLENRENGKKFQEKLQKTSKAEKVLKAVVLLSGGFPKNLTEMSLKVAKMTHFGADFCEKIIQNSIDFSEKNQLSLISLNSKKNVVLDKKYLQKDSLSQNSSIFQDLKNYGLEFE